MEELKATDIAEVMFIPYGKFYGTQIGRIALRFSTPEVMQRLVNAHKRQGILKPTDVAGTWMLDRGRASMVDETTLVVDEYTGPGAADEAQFTPLDNRVPRWADEWKKREKEGILAAISIREVFAGNPDILAHMQKGPEAIILQSSLPLLTKTEWAVGRITAGDKLQAIVRFQCGDEESAKMVRDTLQAHLVLLRNMAVMQARADLPRGNPVAVEDMAKFVLLIDLAKEASKILGSAEFKQEGDAFDVSMQTSSTTQKLAELAQSILPEVEQARSAARQSKGINNLRNLALAMLNYEAMHKRFPAAASHTYRVGGEVRKSEHPHSWRIDLLPLLEQQALYDQYHFDEPWDSEANKKVLAQMPELFRSPFDDPNSTNTSYFVFTGPDTVFPEGDAGSRMVQISDGTSRTWMLVESKRAVPWTKPEDIEYSADKPVPELGGWLPDAYVVSFVDGSVKPVSTELNQNRLRAFITRSGREALVEVPAQK